LPTPDEFTGREVVPYVPGDLAGFPGRDVADFQTVEEGRERHDFLEVLARLVKKQRRNLELQNRVAEAKVRVERRLGEMLQLTVRHGGARRGSRCRPGTLKTLPQGVSKKESSAWQRVAGIPANLFEAHIALYKQKRLELTTRSMIELAKTVKKAAARTKLQEDADAFAAQREGDVDGIYEGDLGLLADLVDNNSLGLILTDPVYDDIELYRRIAELGRDLLKPGRFCLVYVGHEYRYQVETVMRPYLEPYCGGWHITVRFTGGQDTKPYRKVINKSRTVLIFFKPPLGDDLPRVFMDLIDGGGREKSHHKWQQSLSEATYLIDRFSSPGDLIADPCAGSGTVALAAKLSGRLWVATDVDAAAARVARMRLAEEGDG
jgi:hypothetical protein